MRDRPFIPFIALRAVAVFVEATRVLSSAMKGSRADSLVVTRDLEMAVWGAVLICRFVFEALGGVAVADMVALRVNRVRRRVNFIMKRGMLTVL